jgi:ABC-type nitrate/sulfonate/bicarbonate transport system ATPase subunit
MGKIQLKGVRKTFGDVVIIPSIDLDIGDGEFVVFVGPSGCGKSTLLRLIAGLEDVTSGAIAIDGVDMTNVPPARPAAGRVTVARFTAVDPMFCACAVQGVVLLPPRQYAELVTTWMLP